MRPMLVVMLLWALLGAACLTEKEQRESAVRRCAEECANSGYKLDNVDVVVNSEACASIAHPDGVRVNHVICRCVKKP